MTRMRTTPPQPPKLPTLTEDGHGILRDEEGIIVGRRRRHPLADLFKDVPMGTSNMPGMSMGPDIEHLLAIHVFDNMKCRYDPDRSLYVHRTPKKRPAGTHKGAPGVWVPKTVADDPAFEEDPETIEVPDPTGWSPAKLAAAKTAIVAEENAQRMVEQADPHITTREDAGEK